MVVVGLQSGEPGSLDPALNAGGASQGAVEQSICQMLYTTASNHGTLELDPVLATGAPAVSPDKLSYTVQLRQGVDFNDGTPFNAQAVVDSYQRYVSLRGTAYFPEVAGVTATGSYTVVYHLTQPDAAFPGNMYVFSPTAVAREGATFGNDPVCVGPFMLDSWVAGGNITVVKSPYYYKRGAVYLDKIVYEPIPDAAAATEALEAGDIEVLPNVLPSLLPSVEQNPGLRVVESPSLAWNGIAINMGNKSGIGNLPYKNVGTPLAQSPKLRQAFEEAINRNELNKVVFGGLYQPTCTIVPPANTEWYPATSVPCTPYNPAQARKLVAESGFPHPTVHYLCFGNTVQLLFAQFIQAEEAAVGINVVIDAPEIGTYDALAQSGSFDTAAESSGSHDADPNSNFFSRFTTTGSANVGGYSNPRVDYVLSEALKATSFKARAIYYHVAQEIISADRPVIVVYNPVSIGAYSTSLIGVTSTVSGGLNLVNAQYK
jgi:peptide/nickel transport system substrate-binding protein